MDPNRSERYVFVELRRDVCTSRWYVRIFVNRWNVTRDRKIEAFPLPFIDNASGQLNWGWRLMNGLDTRITTLINDDTLDYGMWINSTSGQLEPNVLPRMLAEGFHMVSLDINKLRRENADFEFVRFGIHRRVNQMEEHPAGERYRDLWYDGPAWDIIQILSDPRFAVSNGESLPANVNSPQGLELENGVVAGYSDLCRRRMERRRQRVWERRGLNDPVLFARMKQLSRKVTVVGVTDEEIDEVVQEIPDSFLEIEEDEISSEEDNDDVEMQEAREGDLRRGNVDDSWSIRTVKPELHFQMNGLGANVQHNFRLFQDVARVVEKRGDLIKKYDNELKANQAYWMSKTEGGAAVGHAELGLLRPAGYRRSDFEMEADQVQMQLMIGAVRNAGMSPNETNILNELTKVRLPEPDPVPPEASFHDIIGSMDCLDYFLYCKEKVDKIWQDSVQVWLEDDEHGVVRIFGEGYEQEWSYFPECGCLGPYLVEALGNSFVLIDEDGVDIKKYAAYILRSLSSEAPCVEIQPTQVHLRIDENDIKDIDAFLSNTQRVPANIAGQVRTTIRRILLLHPRIATCFFLRRSLYANVPPNRNPRGTNVRFRWNETVRVNHLDEQVGNLMGYIHEQFNGRIPLDIMIALMDMACTARTFIRESVNMMVERIEPVNAFILWNLITYGILEIYRGSSTFMGFEELQAIWQENITNEIINDTIQGDLTEENRNFLKAGIWDSIVAESDGDMFPILRAAVVHSNLEERADFGKYVIASNSMLPFEAFLASPNRKVFLRSWKPNRNKFFLFVTSTDEAMYMELYDQSMNLVLGEMNDDEEMPLSSFLMRLHVVLSDENDQDNRRLSCLRMRLGRDLARFGVDPSNALIVVLVLKDTPAGRRTLRILRSATYEFPDTDRLKLTVIPERFLWTPFFHMRQERSSEHKLEIKLARWAILDRSSFLCMYFRNCNGGVVDADPRFLPIEHTAFHLWEGIIKKEQFYAELYRTVRTACSYTRVSIKRLVSEMDYLPEVCKVNVLLELNAESRRKFEKLVVLHSLCSETRENFVRLFKWDMLKSLGLGTAVAQRHYQFFDKDTDEEFFGSFVLERGFLDYSGLEAIVNFLGAGNFHGLFSRRVEEAEERLQSRLDEATNWGRRFAIALPGFPGLMKRLHFRFDGYPKDTRKDAEDPLVHNRDKSVYKNTSCGNLLSWNTVKFVQDHLMTLEDEIQSFIDVFGLRIQHRVDHLPLDRQIDYKNCLLKGLTLHCFHYDYAVGRGDLTMTPYYEGRDMITIINGEGRKNLVVNGARVGALTWKIVNRDVYMDIIGSLMISNSRILVPLDQLYSFRISGEMPDLIIMRRRRNNDDGDVGKKDDTSKTRCGDTKGATAGALVKKNVKAGTSKVATDDEKKKSTLNFDWHMKYSGDPQKFITEFLREKDFSQPLFDLERSEDNFVMVSAPSCMGNFPVHLHMTSPDGVWMLLDH